MKSSKNILIILLFISFIMEIRLKQIKLHSFVLGKLKDRNLNIITKIEPNFVEPKTDYEEDSPKPFENNNGNSKTPTINSKNEDKLTDAFQDLEKKNKDLIKNLKNDESGESELNPNESYRKAKDPIKKSNQNDEQVDDIKNKNPVDSNIKDQKEDHSVEDENLGKSVDGQIVGKSVDGQNVGKSVDDQNLGKSVDDQNLGKSVDGQNVGKSVEGQNLDHSKENNKNSQEILEKDVDDKVIFELNNTQKMENDLEIQNELESVNQSGDLKESKIPSIQSTNLDVLSNHNLNRDDNVPHLDSKNEDIFSNEDLVKKKGISIASENKDILDNNLSKDLNLHNNKGTIIQSQNGDILNSNLTDQKEVGENLDKKITKIDKDKLTEVQAKEIENEKNKENGSKINFTVLNSENKTIDDKNEKDINNLKGNGIQINQSKTVVLNKDNAEESDDYYKFVNLKNISTLIISLIMLC